MALGDRNLTWRLDFENNFLAESKRIRQEIAGLKRQKDEFTKSVNQATAALNAESRAAKALVGARGPEVERAAKDIQARKFRAEALREERAQLSELAKQRELQTKSALQQASVFAERQRRAEVIHNQLRAAHAKEDAARVKQANALRRQGIQDALSLNQVEKRGAIDNLLFTFRRLVGVLAIFTLARKTVSVFSQLIRSGFQFAQAVEEAEIGVAGILSTVGQIVDSQGRVVTGMQAFEAATGISKQLMTELRIDALRTTATFEQLAETLQVAVGPALAAGFNVDQVRRFTVLASQAMTAFSIDQRQASEEVRSLLTGQIKPGQSRIATNIGLSGADVRRFKAQGTLFDELEKRLIGFEVAAERVAKTVGGQFTRVADALKIVLGEAAAPARSAALEQLVVLFDKLVTLDPVNKTLSTNPEVVRAFQEIYTILGQIFKLLGDEVKDLDFKKVAAGIQSAGPAIIGTLKIIGGIIGGLVNGLQLVVQLLGPFVTALSALSPLISPILALFIIPRKLISGITSALTGLALRIPFIGKLIETFLIKKFGAAALAAQGINVAGGIAAGAAGAAGAGAARGGLLGLFGLGAASSATKSKVAVEGATKAFAELNAAGKKSFLFGLAGTFAGRVGLIGAAVVGLGLSFAAVTRHVLDLNVSLGEMVSLTGESTVNLLTNLGGQLVILAQETFGTAEDVAKSKRKLDEINRQFAISVRLQAGDITPEQAKEELRRGGAAKADLPPEPEKFTVEQRKQFDEDAARLRAENAERRIKVGLLEDEVAVEERAIQLLNSPERVRETQRIAGELVALKGQIALKKAELAVTAVSIQQEAEKAKHDESRTLILEKLSIAQRENLAEIDLLTLKAIRLKKELVELAKAEKARADASELRSRAALDSARAEGQIDKLRSPAQREARQGQEALTRARQERAALQIEQAAALEKSRQGVLALEAGSDARLQAAQQHLTLEREQTAELLLQENAIKRLEKAQERLNLRAEESISGGLTAGLDGFVDSFSNAFDAALTVAQTSIEALSSFTTDAIVNGLVNVGKTGELSSFFDGIKQLFANFLIQIVNALVAELVKLAIAKSLAAAGFGTVAAAKGGVVPQVRGYAMGGPVGPRASSDTVPAMLTPGEFVITRGATQRYGADVFEGFRRGIIDPMAARALLGSRSIHPRTAARTHFAEGGPVLTLPAGGSGRGGAGVVALPVREDMVERQLNSRAFDNQMDSWLGRNRARTKTRLGI